MVEGIEATTGVKAVERALDLLSSFTLEDPELSVTWLRSVRRRPGSNESQLSRQFVLGPYLWLLVIRVVSACLAIYMIGIGGGAQLLAWIPALLGEFADRIMFFRAIVPITLRGHTL